MAWHEWCALELTLTLPCRPTKHALPKHPRNLSAAGIKTSPFNPSKLRNSETQDVTTVLNLNESVETARVGLC